MIKELYNEFRSHGKQLYMVGGAVRDMVMGVPYERLADRDFTTDATSEEIMKILDRFHVFRTNREFGTLSMVYHDGKRVDISPYHAQYRGVAQVIVPELEPLTRDLSNRDFTINAIAIDYDGNCIDPFGGQDDIKRRLIRAVNNTPEEMLKQHPIRALRGARFVSTLGFQVDGKLFDAIQSLGYLLRDSSPETVLEEMNKLLVGNYVKDGLQFLVDSFIATYILPEILPMIGLEQPDLYHHEDVWEHTKSVTAYVEPYHVRRWGALFHDSGKPKTKSISEGKIHFYGHERVGSEIFDSVAQRLRFPNEERNRIKSLIVHHMRLLQYNRAWSKSSVRRLVYECGDYLEELMELSRADIISQRLERFKESSELLDELEARIKEEKDALKIQLPKGIGDAIMGNLKLESGPEVGRCISLIKDAIIEGVLSSNPSAEECIEFIKRST